jgi:hypothetical protein
MPQGDKSSYREKQKRQAEHIEAGYESLDFAAATVGPEGAPKRPQPEVAGYHLRVQRLTRSPCPLENPAPDPFGTRGQEHQDRARGRLE